MKVSRKLLYRIFMVLLNCFTIMLCASNIADGRASGVMWGIQLGCVIVAVLGVVLFTFLAVKSFIKG